MVKRNSQLSRGERIESNACGMECWHLIRARTAANYIFFFSLKEIIFENKLKILAMAIRMHNMPLQTCTFTHSSVQSRDWEISTFNNDHFDKWGENVDYFTVWMCNAMKREQEREKSESGTTTAATTSARLHAAYSILYSFMSNFCIHYNFFLSSASIK